MDRSHIRRDSTCSNLTNGQRADLITKTLRKPRQRRSRRLTEECTVESWRTTHQSTSIHINPHQSTSIHINPLQSTSILFNPHQSTSIHFNPLQSTSIHFNPLQSTSIHFNPHQSTSIHIIPHQPGCGLSCITYTLVIESKTVITLVIIILLTVQKKLF